MTIPFDTNRLVKKQVYTTIQIGDQFAFFKVIRDTGKSVKVGGRIWECKCRCGKKQELTATQLNRRSKKSCGCFVILKGGDGHDPYASSKMLIDGVIY